MKRESQYLLILLCTLALSACSSNDDDVTTYVEGVKKSAVGKVDVLPPEKPYRGEDYTAQNLPSPFDNVERGDGSDGSSIAKAGAINTRPDADRKREFLEQYPLTNFVMVGTLSKKDDIWGLVRDKSGMVHAVQVGDYIGENSGKIIGISDDKISIIETVSDNKGGWVQSAASLSLKAE